MGILTRKQAADVAKAQQKHLINRFLVRDKIHVQEAGEPNAGPTVGQTATFTPGDYVVRKNNPTGGLWVGALFQYVGYFPDARPYENVCIEAASCGLTPAQQYSIDAHGGYLITGGHALRKVSPLEALATQSD